MAKLIQEYLKRSANKFPRKIAVNCRDKNISYHDLDIHTNQLARLLKEKGVKRGDRVSFCLLKSINSLVSIWSIVKADAIYVPLDARAPEFRIEKIVKDAQPKIIICNKDTLKNVKNLGVEVINLSDNNAVAGKMPTAALEYKSNGDDIAYILYTSGSTGTPKGVMITHANIINATEWAVTEFAISAKDNMSQHPPLHFDLSTFDIYCASRAGATLFLVPEEMSLFPGEILRFMEEKELTIWNSVPSVMVYMSTAKVVKTNRLSTIRQIFFNGEAFPTKFLIEWMKTYPKKTFVNMYGPTETTVQCTFYVIPQVPKDATKLVPIGKACRNVEVFAVKEDGKLAGAGEIGELYVGGRGVGKGYWNDPDHTNQAFVPHPFNPTKGQVYKTGDLVRLLKDGNYEFLGRKDNQVQVMGYRVELGEIESALYSLPYIKEVGVIATIDAKTQGVKVIAFVVLSKFKKESTIKEELGKLLPSYMIPHVIEIRNMLPKTSTGKVDRVTLKEDYGE